MFQKDYLMRQIQQMAQIIAQVLFHRRSEEPEEALGVIDEALNDLPGLDAFHREDMDRDEVLEACRADDGTFNSELAVSVADILREKGEIHQALGATSGRVWLRYAVWLYEAALESGGSAVPWDVHARIEQLKAAVDGD